MKYIIALATVFVMTQAFAAPDMSCSGTADDGAAIAVKVQLDEEASLEIKRNGAVVVSGSGDDVTIGLEEVPQADGSVINAQVISTNVGHGEFGMLMVKPGENKATVFVGLENLTFYADLNCQ